MEKTNNQYIITTTNNEDKIISRYVIDDISLHEMKGLGINIRLDILGEERRRKSKIRILDSVLTPWSRRDRS